MIDHIASAVAAISDTSATNWFSFALVLITGFYVLLTWKILQSNNRLIHTMSEQFQETVRPYVIASLSVREGVLFVLEIKNLGRSSASNLKLKLDRDFYPYAEKTIDRNLKRLGAFNRTIATFSPGEILSFDLSQGFNMGIEENGETLTPTQFEVTVEYDFLNFPYSETFVIDTSTYMGAHVPKSSTEHLRMIEEHLKRLANSR